MDKRPVMAMLIVILLLALNCLLITGNPLDKEIAALRIKIEQQDEALRWLENVTQTQNEKIASLNEQLQQGLEERDLEIDMIQNETSSQKDQLEKLQEDFEEHDLEIDTMQNASSSQKEQLKNLQEHLDEHDDEIDMMQNESSSQKEQLEKLQEDFEEYDVEIDVMQNESSSQKEQLKNLRQHLEEHNVEIDMMQNASNIQEEKFESLSAENRKVRDGDSLLQQQIQNKTETLNIKLQSATNELKTKIQNENDKLDREFTEKYNNMQKDTQKNHKDISKLNSGLIGHRTWGTHTSSSIQNHNYVRLEFKGIGASGFLGCPFSVCDLRSCPYYNNYIRSVNPCNGEQFRIVVENGGSLQAGEHVRFQVFVGSNQWLGCPLNNRCDKRPCPGSLSQAANFNGCSGETFKIYARGRRVGQTILNGDLVMIHLPAYGGKYISIQGSTEGADTSMDYCPGRVPPSYSDYSRCSNNVFRIYKN